MCGRRAGLSVNGVVVEALVEGGVFNASLFNYSLFTVETETNLVVQRRKKCRVGLFFDPVDHECHPCRACEAGERLVRNCTGGFDRVCVGWVEAELDVHGIDFWNASLLDWGALRSYLVDYLVSSGGYVEADIPSLVDSLIGPQRYEHGVSVDVMRCPSASYTVTPTPDPATWECRQCTACAPWEYQSRACGGEFDSVCRNCSVCAPSEVQLAGCSAREDTVCKGAYTLDVEVALDVNSTTRVDRGWLAEWLAQRQLTLESLDVKEAVEARQCGADEYIDGGVCRACHVCGREEFAQVLSF